MRTEVSDHERYRETLPLGSTRRGGALAILLAVGFVWMWRTVGGTRSDALLFALVGAVMVVGVLVITRSRLRTTIQRDAIVIELVGLGETRTLRPADLRGAAVGAFNPLMDDDGWGVFRSIRPSLAWGGAARRGVWLERNDGAPLFLPSATPEELARAIESIM